MQKVIEKPKPTGGAPRWEKEVIKAIKNGYKTKKAIFNWMSIVSENSILNVLSDPQEIEASIQSLKNKKAIAYDAFKNIYVILSC